MKEQDYFKIYEIGEGIYHIWEAPGVAGSLILGDREALLIDTGYGFGNLREAVNRITSLPYRILNTHCHLDHAGGNYLFEQPVFIHPFESEVYEYYQRVQKPKIIEKYLRERRKSDLPWPEGFDVSGYLAYKPCDFLPLTDGESIALGGRDLTVIFLPGHTRGSVAVFDEKTGILFSGDNISNSLWIQFPQSEDVVKFGGHLDKLRSYPIRQIFSSHSVKPWPPELIGYLQETINQISEEESKVFIHPRTGKEARRFSLHNPEWRIDEKIHIVYDSQKI